MNRKRVWIYCRTAYPDADALNLQQANLTLYAQKQGLDVIGITAEHGNGLDFARAGLNEVSSVVRDGRIDLLLVHDLARLGRDLEKTEAYLNWLKQHHVDLLLEDGMKPCSSMEMLSALRQACDAHPGTGW